MRGAMTTFVTDETGQDLIEYALLTAFVGLVGAAAWVAIRAGIGAAYLSWNTGVNDQWQSPAPK